MDPQAIGWDVTRGGDLAIRDINQAPHAQIGGGGVIPLYGGLRHSEVRDTGLVVGSSRWGAWELL